jgi:hypothetical protein
MYTNFSQENMKERKQLEDLSINEKYLTLILKE